MAWDTFINPFVVARHAREKGLVNLLDKPANFLYLDYPGFDCCALWLFQEDDVWDFGECVVTFTELCKRKKEFDLMAENGMLWAQVKSMRKRKVNKKTKVRKI